MKVLFERLTISWKGLPRSGATHDLAGDDFPGCEAEQTTMSMQDFNEAVALMESARDLMEFVGPRDPALIEAAERAIGSRFPPTYREFVTRYGAGNFGAFEIDGVINADFYKSSVPNGIWLTLDERRSGYLPNDLLAIGDDGMGGLYCIELRDGEEGRVILCELGSAPPDQLARELIANDFGEFFLAGVREERSEEHTSEL